MNFKSKKAYEKWLAFGHIHKVFEKVKGNQIVSIRGVLRKVKHGQR